MAKWFFLNNDFVKEEQASLHYRDLSFQRGYGIFDFFRLNGNEPLFLDDHLDRFYFSATEMHLPVPFERGELEAAISQLIVKNQLPDSGIRLSLTGGYSEDGFTIARPNLLISQHSFSPPTVEQRRTGIKLASYSHLRQLPHIKSIDYLMAIWLQPFRTEKGADDVLYHQNGMITECPRSNFFLVTRDKTIATPSKNILKGITRGKLIEIARSHYAVEERDITMEEISTAKGAFITSTTKQILPIRQIDDVIFETPETSHHLQELLTSFIQTG